MNPPPAPPSARPAAAGSAAPEAVALHANADTDADAGPCAPGDVTADAAARAPGEATAAAAAHAWATWLPGQCEICRRWNPARLCADCRARHAAARPRCARCGLQTGLSVAACGACLQDPPPFQHTCCAVDYVYPWAHLLQAFKFHGQDDLAQPLARLLADAVRAEQAHGPAGRDPRSPGGHLDTLPDLLLPVPLSAQRLRQRGYNQAWELARRLGRLLKTPARADVLQRVQQGPTQAGLTREQRQRNLRGAFSLPAAALPRLQGRHLALVDDVMTTGATARAAATVLLAAGAARVDVWVLARTPAPGTAQAT